MVRTLFRAMLALAVAACSEASDGLSLQDGINKARFGEDGQVVATIRAGRFFGALANPDASRDTLPRVVARASGPYPDVSFLNTDANAVRFELELRNVTEDLAFEARTLPAAPGDDLRPACEQTGAPTVTPTLLAPVLDESAPGTFGATLIAPPCGRLELRGQRADTRLDSRFAVARGPRGDKQRLSDLLLAVEAWRGDVLVLVGGLAASGTDPWGYLADADTDFVSRTGRTPPVLLLVPDNDDFDAGIGTWVEAFGPTDFVSATGRVRIALLDNADGILADGQLALLRGGADNPRPGLLFLARPLFDPVSTRNRGMRSVVQAQKVQQLAVDAGYTHIISAVGSADSTRVLGPVTHIDLGPERRRWLQIEIVRAFPGTPICGSDDACDRGACVDGTCRSPCGPGVACDAASRCDDGFCRRICEQAEDCGIDGASCVDGACNSDVRLRVEPATW